MLFFELQQFDESKKAVKKKSHSNRWCLVRVKPHASALGVFESLSFSVSTIDTLRSSKRGKNDCLNGFCAFVFFIMVLFSYKKHLLEIRLKKRPICKKTQLQWEVGDLIWIDNSKTENRDLIAVDWFLILNDFKCFSAILPAGEVKKAGTERQWDPEASSWDSQLHAACRARCLAQR